MIIAIANDHAGVEYKKLLVKHLEAKGYKVTNFGTDSADSCDYPDYAKKVADAVTEGKADKGILICGTGVGMSIAANKFKGIRAALCGDTFSAEMTRRHNDSNVLTLGARVIGTEIMYRIADVYLETPYEGGRHEKRLAKIADFENENR